MIDQKTLVEEIRRLDLVFGVQRGQEDLHMLAATWWKDLSPYMSTESFRIGVQVVRQTCSHYPRPADIIRAHRENTTRASTGDANLDRRAISQHGGVVPHDRVVKYSANIRAIIGNRPLPYPDCVPDPKWRAWQPSAHAGHDTEFAVPGQPLSRYESPGYQPKQAEPGSMHDPRPRRHEPEEQEAAGYSDWDEYREMAANG